MITTSSSSSHHPADVRAQCYDTFFRARPDMGEVAFGFGVLLAANRIRREARDAEASGRTSAPEQLYAVVQGFREEIRVLGHITNQAVEDAALFAILAARLARAAVGKRSSWASLDAAFENFTALFVADFAIMVDELYAAALDPFDNDDAVTQAALNMCEAARTALEEAGYPAAPAQAPRRLATVC